MTVTGWGGRSRYWIVKSTYRRWTIACQNEAVFEMILKYFEGRLLERMFTTKDCISTTTVSTWIPGTGTPLETTGKEKTEDVLSQVQAVLKLVVPKETWAALKETK